MCGGHDFGTGLVNRGMDVEARSIDGKLSTPLCYMALWVYKNKVGRLERDVSGQSSTTHL